MTPGARSVVTARVKKAYGSVHIVVMTWSASSNRRSRSPVLLDRILDFSEVHDPSLGHEQPEAILARSVRAAAGFGSASRPTTQAVADFNPAPRVASAMWRPGLLHPAKCQWR